MSFFGNKENIEKLKQQDKQKQSVRNMIREIKRADLGDIVLFSKEENTFVVYKPDWNLPLDDPNFIVIGIVLAQTETFKTTVLIKGFLMDLPLRIPSSYYGKEQYIPVYVKQMFERYARGFIKKCPAYKKLKRMKLRILSLTNLLDFLSYSIMYEQLKKIIGDEKTKEFYKKIENYHIYVNDRGKLRTWQKPKNEKDDDNVEDVSTVGGHFLTVFDFQI